MNSKRILVIPKTISVYRDENGKAVCYRLSSKIPDFNWSDYSAGKYPNLIELNRHVFSLEGDIKQVAI